jgi:hypothetical protein
LLRANFYYGEAYLPYKSIKCRWGIEIFLAVQGFKGSIVQGSPKTRLPSIGKVLNSDFIGKPVNAYIYFYEIRLKERYELKRGL